jgi:DUF1680 family protein
VNLFLGNTATLPLDGNDIELIQKTGYPWKGEVELFVNPARPQKFELRIRIPGWARNRAIPGNLYRFADSINSTIIFYVNDQQAKVNVSSGYASLVRKWNKGDVVSFRFPVIPRILVADKRVEADRGKIAVQAGPLVYAAEWPDVPDGRVLDLVYDRDLPLQSSLNDTLLNGIMVIETQARRYAGEQSGQGEELPVRLIPYYAWNNRGPGEMMVWLPVDENP